MFTLKFGDDILEQVYQKILWLDLLKINVHEDFSLVFGYEYFEAILDFKTVQD